VNAELRGKAKPFIEQSVAAGIACQDFGAIMPPAMFDQARRWQRHCFDSGFAGLAWPDEYGGQGLASDATAVWAQECAKAGVTPYMNFQGIVLAGPAIIRFGTDDQKDKYLESTLSADIVWCQLFSEPDAGSDLASLTTKADSSDDGWLVSGQKVWSSTAQLATHAILLARTDPETPNHGGISFFVLDMTTPGIEVRPLKQMTGDYEFCEVFLDNVRVGPTDLLGPLNGGWRVTTSVLADERAGVGAGAISLRRRLDHLAAAIDPGNPLLVDQTMAMLVDGFGLGEMMARSSGNPILGPLTKLGSTELNSAISNLEANASGPSAMLRGGPVEDFLYAPGMRVAGGTSEIQRNLIGERLLGLPREPKA
jgi:alkylation response protein AidB-like acyl-CoA dehydrogenase